MKWIKITDETKLSEKEFLVCVLGDVFYLAFYNIKHRGFIDPGTGFVLIDATHYMEIEPPCE